LLDKPEILAKLRPYIRIVYRYTDIDWNVKPSGMFKQQELPARACTLEDFGTHPEGAKVYKEWNGYSMICPDFTNFDIKKTRLDSQTWLLRGSMSSFRISRGEFVIERC